MASANALTTLSLLASTNTSSSNSPTIRSSLLVSPSSSSLCLRADSLHRLGFSAADPLFALHVASRVRSMGTSGKGVRGVVSMAKKSVGDLTAAELKGRRVFVRADLNVPLDDNQNIENLKRTPRITAPSSLRAEGPMQKQKARSPPPCLEEP